MRTTSIFTSIAAGVAMLFFAQPGQAGDWSPPNGTLNLQIGFGAGGETDTLGRIVGKVMAEQTGWNVVVENKPGGGGIAMFTGIAVAPPDGSVIGLGVNIPVIINLIKRGDQLPFNVDSFDYLGTVTRAQLAIIAKADAPYDDIAGLIAYSKANNGAPVAFDAATQEMILKSINAQEGAGLKPVATKSTAEMMQFVLGGQVAASFAAGAHISYVESDRIKVLASANAERHNYAPDVKTLREQGFDFFVDPYFYFAAPAGLPDEVRQALVTALDNALKSDEARTIVKNALFTDVDNKGPEGTKKSLVDGIEMFKAIMNN